MDAGESSTSVVFFFVSAATFEPRPECMEKEE